MKKQEELSKTEEVGGGLIVASLIVSLVLITFIIWPPASHYLSKWSDYWDNKDAISIKISPNLSKEEEAYKSCEGIAKKKETSSNQIVWAYASSTNGEDYQSYDCWGIKSEKINK